MMETIKIILIDSSQIFRKGFTLYLNEVDNFEVINDFNTINEVSNNQLNNVDLVLLDTTTDKDFQQLSEIQKQYPNIAIILLSEEQRIFENYVFASTNNIGAFLSKEVSPERVIETIQRVVLQKETDLVYPANIRERLFGQAHFRESFFSFKELNVLGLLIKGKSNHETGQILNNSYRTIETHRRRMIERLECKNIIPVIMYALENKYLKLEVSDHLDLHHDSVTYKLVLL